MCTHLLMILLACGDASTPPPALRAFEASRKRIANSDFRIRSAYLNVDRSTAFNLRIRTRGSQQIENALGDDAGVWSYDVNSGAPVSQTPPVTWYGDDFYWSSLTGQTHSNKLASEAAKVRLQTRPDFLTLGMFPIDADFQGTVARPFKNPADAPLHYTEEHVGDQYKVTCWYEDEYGRNQIIWWLDPAKDYNATRTQQTQTGGKVFETEVILREYRGAWFPAVVLRYFDGILANVDTVEDAVLNDPAAPAAFKPEDIGVYAGCTVRVWEVGGKDDPGQLRYWTGRELVSERDYRRLESEGKLSISPDALAVSEASRLTTRPTRLDYVDEHLKYGEWANYTITYCNVHNFTREQRATAFRILTRCTEQREKLTRTHRALLDEHKLKADEEFRAVQKLNAEVSKIFEQELKPGLVKLTTRAQMTAEERAEQDAADSKK